MRVKFYLERNKKVKTDRTIWAYVREKGKGLYLNTGEKIKKEYWDHENQRANFRKVKNQNDKILLRDLNQYLNAYENKIFELARGVRIKEVNSSFEKITNELNKYFKNEELTFFKAYDEFLESKRSVVSADAVQKYERTKVLLLEFQKKTNFMLSFEKINLHFFDKFFPFLISKGMINNTAYKNISLLKTFMIWANSRKITNNTDFKNFKNKHEKSEVIFLSEKELMKLYNMDIKEERLQRVRDLFVFQCFTGVRYSDIQNIAKEDIKNATWIVRIKKTHDIIEIPLNSYSLSILAKYKDWITPLPIISNQKMNSYLKELCKKAKISEKIKTVKYRGNERIDTTQEKYNLIGTHTARRTFISLSLQKGMKPEVVMAITGHTTYKMMQKYLKVADSSKRNEMDRVWGHSLQLVK